MSFTSSQQMLPAICAATQAGTVAVFFPRSSSLKKSGILQQHLGHQDSTGGKKLLQETLRQLPRPHT